MYFYLLFNEIMAIFWQQKLDSVCFTDNTNMLKIILLGVSGNKI